MNKRTLGRTGFQVSELGFGLAPVAYLKSEAVAAAAMLNGLLDQGLNLIDTATSYPGSQAFIGEHLAHRRDEYVLVSKVSGKFKGVAGPDWSEAVVTACVDNALKECRTDRLDVMLLHTCDSETLKKGEAVAALAKARDAGKIRFGGFSGDNEAAAYAAGLDDLAVIETSINVADQKNIDVLLPVAREKDVGVLVKRPIANAAWKDLNTQPGMYKNYAAAYTDRLAKMNVTPADLGFAGDASAAWAGIALRFTLGFPGVTCALVGTTNPANAQKNIDAIEAGPLPDDVIEALRAAFKRADPDGQWPGLT